MKMFFWHLPGTVE